jgi:hypothetical protein
MEPYLKEIQTALMAGNATEHTHRPALTTFVESLATGITATNEPKALLASRQHTICLKPIGS